MVPTRNLEIEGLFHEPNPLTPSLSPTGGEGARRAGEGDSAVHATDLFPKRAIGTVAGLVGLGGAMGGVVLGQVAGYLLDHGFSYAPVLVIAGSLHIIAFLVLLTLVRSLEPLSAKSPGAA